MQKTKNYSMKMTQFMAGFRKFLNSNNMASPQQFLSKTNFINPGWISQYQFLKIVQNCKLNNNYDAMDIVSMYKQLDDGWQQVQLKNFIEVYNIINKNHPNHQSYNKVDEQKRRQEEQKKRQQEEKQRKTKIIRLGLKKLQHFIAQNDPISLFQQCDEDSSGKLDPNQFNKLLIRTDIKQFQDKLIRKVVVKQIFSYFPNKQIKRDQYIKFFKIPKQKIQKRPQTKQQKQQQKKPQVKFFIPPQKVLPFSSNQQKKPQINTYNKYQNNTLNQKKIIPPNQQNVYIKPPTINIRAPQNKNVTVNQIKNGFKKKRIPEQLQKNVPLNKNQSQQYKNQIVQANSIFPHASVYYRHGLPSTEQLVYFEELENLIVKRKTYRDNQNPVTTKGKYCQAINFFNGASYKLFQMAQSVILRQKSRIGVARDIQPKDIIQGQIGDCYFLSSIASLISIYPEVLSQKFLFNQNPAGYYVVKIFLDGQWKFLTTDDTFPSQNGRTALYARPHGRQIWVMLLQKCWAKCFGSFKSIVSGSPKQGFAALTGAPTQYLSLKSKQMTQQIIQNKIKQAYSLRHVVTASGSDYLQSLSQKQQQNLGLIGSHAYSFLKFIDANGITLVKIRNPWGTRIWKGQWSFQSNKWSKALRDKFNYHKCPDDGSFYMNMKDFLKYFGSFVICKLNPIYTHSSIKTNYKNHKSNYTKMRVSQSGRYVISLYQQNQRKMNATYSNYKYSPSRIIVMKIRPQWEYIDSSQNSGSYSISVDVDLQEGCEYIISTKFKWKFWEARQGCLNSYGPQKVIFQPIGRQIADKFKTRMIESFFKKNRGKTKDYNKTGAIGSYSEHLFSIQKGIGYYFITNPSNKKFDLTYSLQGQGIKVIKPDKLPFTFDLYNGSKYLKGFFTSSQGFNYQSSQSMTY